VAIWPTPAALHANWPLLAADLLVAAWKIAGAEALAEKAEIGAGLTSSERLVIRGWLMGDDAATIAADLGWRPQTVVLLLRNARARLHDPRWAEPTRKDAFRKPHARPGVKNC
jgi:hypothetical protein